MAKTSVFVVISSFIEKGDEAKFGNGIDGIFETRKLAERFCDLQGRRIHSDNGTLRWEKDEGSKKTVYDIVEFRFHSEEHASNEFDI